MNEFILILIIVVILCIWYSNTSFGVDIEGATFNERGTYGGERIGRLDGPTGSNLYPLYGYAQKRFPSLIGPSADDHPYYSSEEDLSEEELSEEAEMENENQAKRAARIKHIRAIRNAMKRDNLFRQYKR